MPGRRRPPSRSGGRSRRGLLFTLCGGVASLFAVGRSSDAFSTAAADRSTGVGVANDDTDGVFELDAVDVVQKNQRERLFTITNTLAEGVTVTASTGDPGTTLYADGKSGASVSFPLDAGVTDDVEVESGADGEIDYTVEAVTDSGTLDFSATRTVEVQAGNVGGPVVIETELDASADPDADEFAADRIRATSELDAETLDRVEYVATDSSGTEVASATDTGGAFFSADRNEYRIKNNPNDAFPFAADDPIQAGEEYVVTATVVDTADNTAETSATVTA